MYVHIYIKVINYTPEVFSSSCLLKGTMTDYFTDDILSYTSLLSIIPQMVILHKDPKGEAVFDKTTTLSTVETGESALKKSVDSDTIATLTERIKQLESELQANKVINNCSKAILRGTSAQISIEIFCSGHRFT